jgi:hypothetical protein
METKRVAAKLSELRGLGVAPVAVAFRAAAPAGAGRVGNRVYTGLGGGELYFTVPGAALADVVQKIETVVHANRELGQYSRAASLSFGAGSVARRPHRGARS